LRIVKSSDLFLMAGFHKDLITNEENHFALQK